MRNLEFIDIIKYHQIPEKFIKERNAQFLSIPLFYFDEYKNFPKELIFLIKFWIPCKKKPNSIILKNQKDYDDFLSALIENNEEKIDEIKDRYENAFFEKCCNTFLPQASITKIFGREIHIDENHS